MDKMKRCDVCGDYDDFYDGGAPEHKLTAKHKCNVKLLNYNHKKKMVAKYGEGVMLKCTAETFSNDSTLIETQDPTDHLQIRICMKPSQRAQFTFSIQNNMNDEDLSIVGVLLAHPQPQFELMNVQDYDFDKEPQILKSKHSIGKAITVCFTTKDMGQYEMPIMFTFHRSKIEKDFVFIRELIVMVQNEAGIHKYPKTPFDDEPWKTTDDTKTVPPVGYLVPQYVYNIPMALKKLYTWNLNEDLIERSRCSDQLKELLRSEITKANFILHQGVVKDNYVDFFHNLLYWEETKVRISLRKYNMIRVTLIQDRKGLWLEVPGLAEKRPSLLRGDLVCIRPHENMDLLFEAVIKDIEDDRILLANMQQSFNQYYHPEALFDIRFLMSRVPMERMHDAVSKVFTSFQSSRIFPVAPPCQIPTQSIEKFHNEFIKDNPEQRSAVEHIVAGTSGLAPYIVFGPPGTGKTMTIVEAIIQIIVRNPQSRVLVCTDSNMAADHIAVMLMKYNQKLNINRFLLRANSRNREWSILPQELHNVSNGKSFKDFFSVTNDFARSHRILVTTLLHAAKYGLNDRSGKVKVSHLFIDEAAQSMEPAALVPITNLLTPKGQLVLAGDPMQLGPVCLSHQAKDRGLGRSLLERLWQTYSNLYGINDPSYATVLVNNFRSHPDILMIPNEFFYSAKPLQPKAEQDSLSEKSILGDKDGEKALVFHSVNSKEQRTGEAPSYFNDMELKLLQTYVKALTVDHNVSPKDIGIIAPYIRQVYKMKDWLKNHKYEDVEVGSVEAFQGKEKRVILLSTVRANCKLLDYDAKYNLGFIRDRKRFNVALTRAKAKIIIIGNPACLIRCLYWRRYMEVTREMHSYLGKDSEQIERTSEILEEVTRTRFDRCRLTEVFKQVQISDGNNNQPAKLNSK